MEQPADAQAIAKRPKPESAAVAGIVYALAAGAALLIINSIPKGMSETQWSDWISDSANTTPVYWSVTLATFAAVAFLWFIAVIRRRLGEREDKFFASVFFGSALVYVGLWLVAASIVGAPTVLNSLTGATITWDGYLLIEGIAGSLLVYVGPRIQAIFVASTSMMFIRTGVVPKWLGYAGLVLAVAMFLLPVVWSPIGLGLPVFVLITSLVVLLTRSFEPGRSHGLTE